MEEKLLPCRPSSSWCVLIMAIHAFAKEASRLFRFRQGMKTLMSQKVVELFHSLETLFRLVDGKEPVLQSEVNAMAETTAGFGDHVTTKLFAASISNVEQFVMRLETFVSSKLDENPTENGARHHALSLFGAAILSAASQLALINVKLISPSKQADATDQFHRLCGTSSSSALNLIFARPFEITSYI